MVEMEALDMTGWMVKGARVGYSESKSAMPMRLAAACSLSMAILRRFC